jgi:outer membrane receptor protein involved in Fe transport
MLTFDREGETYSRNRLARFILTNFVSAPEKDFLYASIGGEWNGWELSLFGRNLLDERDPLAANVNGITPQARPRTVGISIKRTFE